MTSHAPNNVTDFLAGHTDPTTLPRPVIEATPTEMLGYVATAYLAGVEVGRVDAEARLDRSEDAGQALATAKVQRLGAAIQEAHRELARAYLVEDDPAPTVMRAAARVTALLSALLVREGIDSHA